jgi:hypothetical protein
VSDQAQVPDGLLALQSKREAAKRSSPLKRTIRPSQNPNRLPPYKAPDAVDGGDGGDGTASPTAASQPVAAPRPAKRPPQPEKDDAPAPIVRVTSYVDESQDAYLDDVKFVGVRQRTKIDVSRSAVMRFALERLMADMTPEQAYEAIAAKPVDSKASGRKRR